ncbi:MAG: type II toxin-antitoxin system RelE/ParE family toxin [Pseudomonadota bacterium]
MIVSFACKETEKLFKRSRIAPQWRDFASVALRKLTYLNSAIKIDDLRIPPSNNLEKLKGDRKDQFSVRINLKWRICFEFEHGDAFNVEIVDYH